MRGRLKGTTYQSYGSLVKLHLSPTLGRMKLSALTSAHVQMLYRANLDEGLAPKTVKYIHTTLQPVSQTGRQVGPCAPQRSGRG